MMSASARCLRRFMTCLSLTRGVRSARLRNSSAPSPTNSPLRQVIHHRVIGEKSVASAEQIKAAKPLKGRQVRPHVDRPEVAIEGCLLSKGISMVVASPGAGKTNYSCEEILSLGIGPSHPFMGKF